MTTRKNARLAVLMPLVFLLALACSPKSPEEKVAKLRSYYTARPIGFIVDATPVEPVDMGDEDELAAEDEPMAPEAAEGGEAEVADTAPVAMRQDVRLDILLQHDSPEKLPGITLDIFMVDAGEVEIANWKVWVETADLPKATGTQFTRLLEDIDYEEGYQFSVEVRHPIPVEERSAYREFAGAGTG